MQIELSDSRQNMNKGYTAFPVKTLGTIMKELKHDWVDVMKVDIEGAEWGFLADLVAKRLPLPFTQLQVHGMFYLVPVYLVPNRTQYPQSVFHRSPTSSNFSIAQAFACEQRWIKILRP